MNLPGPTLRVPKHIEEELAQGYRGEIMMRHCLHTTTFNVTKEPSDEAFGSTEKLCCDCGKVFNIMFKYKLKPQLGHGPYHVMREIVYNNYPDEECPNASER